ncbi:MAG TPA: AraC family transcriptional regulator [Sphaerochaeta sp.]|nr:AraC family transcriptional regulator [Sphaerochaeta sp.]
MTRSKGRAHSVTPGWILKVFIPIASIFLLTMIIMALLFSGMFTNVAQSLIVDDFLASLKMISTYYRQMRFNTVPILDDLSDAQEIRDYLLQNLPKDKAMLGAYLRLENTVARNSYIHSIYLYNDEYGFFSTISGAEVPGELSDSTLLEFLATRPKNKNLYQRRSVFTDKTIPLSLPKKPNTPTNLYTICNLSYGDDGEVQSGIIMNLSETLARSLLADDEGTSKNFYMIDEGSYIISHPDPDQFGRKATSLPLLSQIASFDGPKGGQTLKDDEGKQFLACWYDIGEMNWRLIFILPMSHIREPLNHLRKNLVFVFIGLALIASLVLVWESKRINNQLTRENRFIDYLTGGLSAEALPLYEGQTFFIAVILRQTKKPESELLQKNRFISFASQYLRFNGKNSFLLTMDQGQHVYLALHKPEKVISRFAKLLIDLGDLFDEQLSIFYSTERVPLEDLPRRYEQMRRRLLSSSLTEVGFISEIEQEDTKEVNLFLTETADMEKALSQRSAEAYAKSVDTLITNLKRQDDFELFSAMKQYLSYSIVALIGDVFQASEIMTAQEWKHALLSSRTYDDLKEGLLLVARILEEYREQYSKRQGMEQVLRIRELVAEHLRDKNLSAKFIADEIGLSLGYTRNLFKTIEGVALNEYIGMKRIDEAKDLLSTTKQSINAIRESLGFSNTAYFCTYFKKQTGKSPSEYRNEQRKAVQS